MLRSIYGNPKENSGQISLAIGRSETDRKKMSTRVKRRQRGSDNMEGN